MPDVELKIKADVAEAERQIAKVKESIKDLGQQERQLAANPLNPSPAKNFADRGIRPDAVQSPVANATALNNPAKLEAFRQSLAGYKEIGIEAEKAALKANLLNTAAAALPPELNVALALSKGITAQTTILGANVVSLVGTLGVGAVAIFAVYKVTQQIEDVAKQRLALEEKITGEFNKQNILAAELNKLRAEAAEKRNFDKFLREGSPEALQKQIAELTQQQQAAVAEAAELRRRQQAVQNADNNFRDITQGGLPILGKLVPVDAAKKAVAGLDEQIKTADEKARSFTDRILKLDEAVLESKQRRADADVEITRFAERTKFELQSEANRAANEQAKKFEQEKQRMIDEAIRKAKEYAAYVVNARATTIDVFARTSQNRFVQDFAEVESAIERVTKATEKMGGGLSKTLAGLIANRAAANAYGQDVDNRLKALDLRDRARDLDRGYRRGDEDRIRQQAEKQIYPNYSSPEAREEAIKQQSDFIRSQETREQQADLSRRLALLAGGGRENDQRIIALTQSVDLSQLDGGQRTKIRDATLREADNLENERQESVELIRSLKKLISDSGIKVDLDGQAITNVIVESKDVDATKRQRSVYGKPISTKDSMLP